MKIQSITAAFVVLLGLGIVQLYPTDAFANIVKSREVCDQTNDDGQACGSCQKQHCQISADCSKDANWTNVGAPYTKTCSVSLSSLTLLMGLLALHRAGRREVNT